MWLAECPLVILDASSRWCEMSNETLPDVAVQGTDIAACCAAQQPDLLWMCWDQKAECCAGSSARPLGGLPRKAP